MDLTTAPGRVFEPCELTLLKRAYTHAAHLMDLETPGGALHKELLARKIICDFVQGERCPRVLAAAARRYVFSHRARRPRLTAA